MEVTESREMAWENRELEIHGGKWNSFIFRKRAESAEIEMMI